MAMMAAIDHGYWQDALRVSALAANVVHPRSLYSLHEAIVATAVKYRIVTLAKTYFLQTTRHSEASMRFVLRCLVAERNFEASTTLVDQLVLRWGPHSVPRLAFINMAKQYMEDNSAALSVGSQQCLLYLPRTLRGKVAAKAERHEKVSALSFPDIPMEQMTVSELDRLATQCIQGGHWVVALYVAAELKQRSAAGEDIFLVNALRRAKTWKDALYALM
jgi:hypothetical protein